MDKRGVEKKKKFKHFFQRTPLDVSYFDTAFTEEAIKLTPVESSLLRGLDQRQFKGFSLTNKLYTLK